MVEICILGEVQVVHPVGRRLTIKGRARCTVLAHLATAAPGVATSEALIDTLWPKGAPSSHRSGLRNTISWLRRQLTASTGDDPIPYANGGYRLHPSIRIDASEFQEAVELTRPLTDPQVVVGRLGVALGRWRGDAYHDLEAHRFVAERQRLDQLRLEAVERHQFALISLGRAAEGLPLLLTELDQYPFHEGLIEALMLSHYALGDQVEALRLFETIRRDLNESLGLEPSPRLASAELTILRHDPIDTPFTVQPQARPDVDSATAADGLSPPAPPSSSSSSSSSLPSASKEVSAAVSAGITARPGQVHEPPPSATRVISRRADLHASLGHFAAAAEEYLQAAHLALEAGDIALTTDLTMRLARVTWDPEVEASAIELIDAVEPRLNDQLRLAAIRLCRAGGLHRDGAEGAESSGRRNLSQLQADLETARRRGSPTDLAWAITHFREAVAGVLPAEDSLALAEEVASLKLSDPVIVRQNNRALFVDRLRTGRRNAARMTLAALVPTAADREPAVNEFGSITARNCWDLSMGRWADVQTGLAALVAFRGRLGPRIMDQVILGQSFWLTREIGDTSTAEAHYQGARGLASTEAITPLWTVAAALLATDLQQFEEAVDLVNDADDRFDLSAVPAGSHQLPILALTAETLALAGRGGHRPKANLAVAVAHQLDRDPGPTVLAGWPVVFLGSKHRYQGFALLAHGDREAAARHLRAAVRDDRWSPPLRARSLDGLALATRGREAVRAREGAATIRHQLLSHFLRSG